MDHGLRDAQHTKSFAYSFYVSDEWRRCRAEYIRSKGGLCERCRRAGRAEPATQVHHKTRITPKNIMDPSITLNFDNLEALCDECHRQEHHPIRYRVAEDGHVDLMQDPPWSWSGR